jgi:hypothetical protein
MTLTVSGVLGRGPLIRVFLNVTLGFGFQTHSGTDVKLEIYTLLTGRRPQAQELLLLARLELQHACARAKPVSQYTQTTNSDSLCIARARADKALSARYAVQRTTKLCVCCVCA